MKFSWIGRESTLEDFPVEEAGDDGRPVKRNKIEKQEEEIKFFLESQEHQKRLGFDEESANLLCYVGYL